MNDKPQIYLARWPDKINPGMQILGREISIFRYVVNPDKTLDLYGWQTTTIVGGQGQRWTANEYPPNVSDKSFLAIVTSVKHQYNEPSLMWFKLVEPGSL